MFFNKNLLVVISFSVLSKATEDLFRNNYYMNNNIPNLDKLVIEPNFFPTSNLTFSIDAEIEAKIERISTSTSTNNITNVLNVTKTIANVHENETISVKTSKINTNNNDDHSEPQDLQRTMSNTNNTKQHGDEFEIDKHIINQQQENYTFRSIDPPLQNMTIDKYVDILRSRMLDQFRKQMEENPQILEKVISMIFNQKSDPQILNKTSPETEEINLRAAVSGKYTNATEKNNETPTTKLYELIDTFENISLKDYVAREIAIEKMRLTLTNGTKFGTQINPINNKNTNTIVNSNKTHVGIIDNNINGNKTKTNKEKKNVEVTKKVVNTVMEMFKFLFGKHNK